MTETFTREQLIREYLTIDTSVKKVWFYIIALAFATLCSFLTFAWTTYTYDKEIESKNEAVRNYLKERVQGENEIQVYPPKVRSI